MTEKRPRFQRRTTILYPLLLVLIGVAVGPLVLLSARLISTNRSHLRRGQQELQLSLAKAIAQEIENHVRNREGELRIVAEGLGALRDAAGSEELRARLSSEVALGRFRTDHLRALRVTAPDGTAIGTTAGGAELFAVPGLAADLDAAQRAAAGGQNYRGRPHLLPNYEAVLLVSTAIPAPSAPYDAVHAVMTLEPVAELLASRTSDAGGYTFYVLDADLRLFAHSEKARVIQGEDMSIVPLVQRYDSNRDVPASSTEQFELPEPDGPRRMLGTYVPLRRLGWAVFVQTDERAAFDVVRSMVRSSVVWLAAAFAAAALIAVFFADRVRRPIRELADGSREIARGNFSRRIPVRSSDEIGELADTFNHMTEEIQDYIEQLKKASEVNNRIMLGSIRALAAAIDEKDPYTRGHSQRVSRYALLVGTKLGLARTEMRNLDIGSILHDIGKIGIEDRILKKPAALTPEEFEVMKQHPLKGANIMAQIEHLKEIMPILRNHHERYDGKGYPDKLRGEEIPLLARIVTVADTFDAMTTDRPYQKAMSFRVALAKMIEFKGKALDPKLVDAMIQCYHQGELGPDRNDTGEGAPLPHPQAVPAAERSA